MITAITAGWDYWFVGTVFLIAIVAVGLLGPNGH